MIKFKKCEIATINIVLDGRINNLQDRIDNDAEHSYLIRANINQTEMIFDTLNNPNDKMLFWDYIFVLHVVEDEIHCINDRIGDMLFIESELFQMVNFRMDLRHVQNKLLKILGRDNSSVQDIIDKAK